MIRQVRKWLGKALGGKQEECLWQLLEQENVETRSAQLSERSASFPLTRFRFWRWMGHELLWPALAQHPELTERQARQLKRKAWGQARTLPCEGPGRNRPAIRACLQTLVKLYRQGFHELEELGEELVRMFGLPHHDLPKRAYGRVAGNVGCPHRLETLKALSGLPRLQEQRLLELILPVKLHQPSWASFLLAHPQAGLRVWKRGLLEIPGAARTTLEHHPDLPRKRSEVWQALVDYGQPDILEAALRQWPGEAQAQLIEEISQEDPTRAAELANRVAPVKLSIQHIQTLLEADGQEARKAGLRLAAALPGPKTPLSLSQGRRDRNIHKTGT